MSNYLYHTACSKCGSRDANAVYEGGTTWCFSCRSYGTLAGGAIFKKTRPPSKSIVDLPDDLSHSIFPLGKEWLDSYEITPEMCIRYDILGTKRFQQVVFLWKDSEDAIIGAQCRNFHSGKPKYLSYGDIGNLLPIYRNSQSLPSTLVLVEDVLSAVKVLEASRSPAMPCLTSGVPPLKLKRLAGLFRAFTVWLDGNMYPNAQKMVRQLQLLGCTARAIWTPKDPKTYTKEEINKILLTGGI
jgi:hypothetical protein